MRLNQYHRQAFVKAAMNDVPTIDYQVQVEKLVINLALGLLPEAIQNAYKDPQAKKYIGTFQCYFAGLSNFEVPGLRWSTISQLLPQLSQADKKAISNLLDLHKEQRKMLDDLEKKLTATSKAYQTRKTLAEALPEFAKYLPDETDTTINRALPVVTNVVTDFIKAGWPKNQPKQLAPKPVQAP